MTNTPETREKKSQQRNLRHIEEQNGKFTRKKNPTVIEIKNSDSTTEQRSQRKESVNQKIEQQKLSNLNNRMKKY